MNQLSRGDCLIGPSGKWRVSGMVFKPGGVVDWYCLVPEPSGKDPFSSMIRVSPEEAEKMQVIRP